MTHTYMVGGGRLALRSMQPNATHLMSSRLGVLCRRLLQLWTEFPQAGVLRPPILTAGGVLRAWTVITVMVSNQDTIFEGLVRGILVCFGDSVLDWAAAETVCFVVC